MRNVFNAHSKPAIELNPAEPIDILRAEKPHAVFVFVNARKQPLVEPKAYFARGNAAFAFHLDNRVCHVSTFRVVSVVLSLPSRGADKPQRIL